MLSLGYKGPAVLDVGFPCDGLDAAGRQLKWKRQVRSLSGRKLNLTDYTRDDKT